MSSINTSFNSNLKFNYNSNKNSNIEYTKIISNVATINGNASKFNKKTETETLDMEEIEVAQVESLTKEEYDAALKKYKKYLQEQKKMYEKPLEDLNKEIAALEYNSYADPAQWAYEYKDKYDLKELQQILKEYDFKNHKEFKKILKQKQADKALLEAAIYEMDQLSKTAKYDYLDILEDYQNFDISSTTNDYEAVEGENLLKYYRLFSDLSFEFIDLEDYCKMFGLNYNKLDEYEIAKKMLKENPEEYIEHFGKTEIALLIELDDQELLKKYKYIFKTQGQKAAKEYLSDMKDSLNKQVGAKRAEAFLAGLKVDEDGNYDNKSIINHLYTCAGGSVSGVDSFFRGLTTWFDKEHVYSPGEYESMYIMEALKKNKSFTNFLDNNYELSQSLGNMVPSILIGYATGSASFGTAMMGASSGGNAYHTSMVEGHDKMESIAYGVFSGLSEATLQHYLGAIPGLNDVKVTSFKTYLQSIGSEALEEGSQELLDTLLRSGIFGEEIDCVETLQNVLKSSGYGAIMGAMFNAPDLAVSTTVKLKNGEYGTKKSWFIENFAKKKSNVETNSVTDVNANASSSNQMTNDEILNLNRDLTSSEKTQIWGEYNDIIDKWGDDFDYYKNTLLNHGAGDLIKLSEMDSDLKRLTLIEGKLGIKGEISVVNATEDYKVSNNNVNNEVNEGPIPIINENKIDTNSPQYKEAMREIYSKASPTGKQVLDSTNNPFINNTSKIKLDDLKYSKNTLSKYALEYLKSNFRKYSYINTNMVGGLNNDIKNNGLYHFTNSADAILNSGYIKKTGSINSYGIPKTFFFNGVPSVGQIATNIDSIPLTATAVKVNPTDDVISSNKLKVRNIDDGAISFDGNFDLTNSNATKEYFCVFKEGNELVYKSVSKEFYDNYANTAEGKAMAEFLSNKKNVEYIKTDYLSSISSKNINGGNNVILGLKNHVDSMFSPQLGIIDSNISWFLNNIGKKNKVSNNTAVSSVNEFQAELQRFDNAKRYTSDQEIAIAFDDAKQYLYTKLKYLAKHTSDPNVINAYNSIKKMRNMDKPIDQLYMAVRDYLNGDEEHMLFSIFNNKNAYGSKITPFEQDEIYIFSRITGPILAAYERGVDTEFVTSKFQKALYEGSNKVNIQGSLTGARAMFGYDRMEIDTSVKIMDKIINKTLPLKQDTILYRGTNGLFCNGTQLNITDLKVGQVINDKAMVSTSLLKEKCYDHNDIILEILAPKGTKGAYLESYVQGYGQQEFLLGRNTNFKVVSEPEMKLIDGKYKPVVKVKIIDNSLSSKIKNIGSSIVNKTKTTTVNNNVKFNGPNVVRDMKLFNIKNRGENLDYNRIFNPYNDGVDIYDFVDKLKNKGFIEIFNDQVLDIHKKDLYGRGQKGTYQHDVEHVERVMLFSMYMANELNLSGSDMNLLIEATKYHDVGVYMGHKGHASYSASEALNNLKNDYSVDDLNKIGAIIEYHELGDTVENFEYVIQKYNISSQDRNSVLNISNILKDADALDRTRFMRNLDVRYFRNSDLANNLVKTSYQMQSIRGEIDLNLKLENGVFSASDLGKINHYRNIGVPDYIINQAYENYSIIPDPLKGYRCAFDSPEAMIKFWVNIQ